MSSRLVVLVAALVACGARTELGAPRTDDRDAAALDGDAANKDAGPPPSPCHVTAPTTLASGGKEIQYIALDDDTVYWTDFALGTVEAVPKAGGEKHSVAVGQDSPSGVVVVSNAVYWTEFGGDAVARAPVSGGPSEVLATNQGGAYEITAAGTDVYWTNVHGCSVARYASDGTVHVVAHTKQPFTAIASTSTLVFWVSFQSKAVERFDVASTTISTLLSGTGFDVPKALATDGTNVYYVGTSPTDVTLGAVSTNGGDAHTLYASPCDVDASAGTPCAGDVATDGTFVYFTTATDVRKVPVTGGDATKIADGQARPFAVAVDDACVYWSNLGDGTIWAAPR